jgi:ribosomal protein L19
VTRIGLDGADPDSVSVTPMKVDDNLKSFPSRTEKRYDDSDDLLVVRTYFAAREPGEYTVDMELTGSNGTGERFRSVFTVTPSKPVPRLDVTRSGTGPDVQNWGMVVDASDSFDPDGDDLYYEWSGGAQTLTKSSIAKFDSRETAKLLIEDENQNSVRVEGQFLDYYNPGLETIEVTSAEDVSRGDSVYFRISTPTYAFTKNTYQADLSVSVVGDGRVLEWKNVEQSISEGAGNSPGSPEDATEQRYTGLVVVDRDEFDDGDLPAIRIYNDAQPETTAVEYPISSSDARDSEAVRREDVTFEYVRYEVETDRNETYVTSSPDEKARYVANGYEVVDQRREPVEYELERGLVRWETETERRTFESESARKRFLANSQDEWRRAGTETTTDRRPVTEYVWRDSGSGEGQFTGDTKRVMPTYVDRRTEFEYVEHVTETVKKIEIMFVPLPSGEVKEVEQVREKTVTRNRTYWATTRESPDHVATGASRQVIPDDAYETQFEHIVERYETVEVTQYVVERATADREMVWVDAETADGDSNVRQRVRARDDLRIVNTKLKTEWVLRGPESQTIVRNEYSNKEDVNRTIVYISGKIREGEDTWEFQERLTFEGALTEAEIHARIEDSEGGRICGEDDPVTSGCGVEE